MTLLVAIVTAAVFAVFGLPYQHYQCWFSFSRIGTIVGTFLYFLLAGGGGGTVGWAVATLANADPTSNIVLNGVLYGITGALALRADFAAGPRPDTTGDRFADARSALTLGIKWTTTLLDVVAARRAEAWLIDMSDEQLSQEALRVHADIKEQPDTLVSDKVKIENFERLVGWMEQLGGDDDRLAWAARAQLIKFCIRYYTERHLAKTPSCGHAGAPAHHAPRLPPKRRHSRCPARRRTPTRIPRATSDKLAGTRTLPDTGFRQSPPGVSPGRWSHRCGYPETTEIRHRRSSHGDPGEYSVWRGCNA